MPVVCTWSKKTKSFSLARPHWDSGTDVAMSRRNTIFSSLLFRYTQPCLLSRPCLRRNLATAKLDSPVTTAPVSMSALYSGAVHVATIFSTLLTDQSEGRQRGVTTSSRTSCRTMAASEPSS